MSNSLTLIIDDEPDIRELLELTLGRMKIDTMAAENLKQAIDLLSKNQFAMCLTDMKLPDGDGLDIVKYIQEHSPNTPVAVITAHGSMELAIEALKAGAFDFVSKPVDLQILRNLVNTALKVTDVYPSVDRRSRDTLIGDSPAMQATRATITKVARSQAPVYISGESGTGKELVAKLIHAKGPRANNPFVPVNCGAIPNELMESEFFGHKKGSFTGANTDKEGLFQAADGGTLFFDEVADLPLHMQVKLLRAIQEKSVRPVGANREIPTDVRLLSATHKELEKLVGEGKFRQDLYYRINVIDVNVPPLRERGEDVAQLTGLILGKLSHETSTAKPEVNDDAMNALRAYAFPGNVRELENILERASTLCEDNVITPKDLRLPKSTAPDIQPKSKTEPASAQKSAPMPKSSADANDLPLEDHLSNIEKDAIVRALEKTRYNKTAAAKLLGMSFRALRYRLKKLDLD